MFSPDILSEIVAPTIEVIGHVLIALVVMSVHTRVAQEHKIDQAVIRYMKRERVYAMIGIVLVLAGFVIELIF